uniref:Uncharacterized protein n=1 Tax=Ditylum brightwellii TaxID=49249 RepID=A0A6V2P2K8_9STRA|mmetsp:Transcript_5523/g.7299  ORF Transcript_5523/g.7299 Transcript_5523/m.7299 type:complete len:106 (+) Transcript_5523:176-493(+)
MSSVTDPVGVPMLMSHLIKDLIHDATISRRAKREAKMNKAAEMHKSHSRSSRNLEIPKLRFLKKSMKSRSSSGMDDSDMSQDTSRVDISDNFSLPSSWSDCNEVL